MDNEQMLSQGGSAAARSRWGRRLLKALAGLLLLWLVGWLGLPPLLKWQLQQQGSAWLGRTVTVERVDFRPWTLELAVEGLRVAQADGTGEQLWVQRLYADAELQSVLRLAPVIDALAVESPRLHLRHLGAGRYDIDDILQRLSQPESTEPSRPLRFALFNLRLSQGALTVVDEGVQATHELRDLALDVPFLSNLPSRREIVTQPRLAFVLNGSAFDSSAASTPFAQTRHTEARLDIPALDLSPYLAYWPAQWPLRLESGVLQLGLTLAFEQRETPQVLLSGEVAVSQLRLAQYLDGVIGPLLAFERLGVKLREVEPLARRVALEEVRWDGPQLSLTRDAAGRLNLQRVAQAWGALVPAPADPATPSPVPVPVAGATDWRVTVDRWRLAQGQLHWADAAVRPAAQLELADLRWEADQLQWPMTAPVPFQASARLGQTPVTVQGTATHAAVQAQLGWDGWPLAMAAPYVADVLQPTLDGRLSGDLTLDWRAAAEGQPMALLLEVPRLALQDLRLGPAQRPLARWQQLMVQGARVDLVAHSVSLEQLVLDRPVLQVERDREGRWMVERWLRAAPMPAAPADARAGGGPKDAGWKLALADFRLMGGRIGWVDQQPARPVALTLSDVQMQAKNLRPLDARQAAIPVSLSARVGSVERADPGRLHFTGSLRLPAAQPTDRDGLRLLGQVQAERLPVHALEPYFGDRLNLELLRADASYRGRVDAALPPAGLSLALAGDVAVEDFRANTLSPSEDLLAWKALNLRGLELSLAPGRATRLVVAETALSDYFARVIIHESGRINLQGLVKAADDSVPSGSATATAVASAPAGSATVGAAAEAAGPAPDIRFGPVSLVQGRVFFSDRFIKPNYSANLSELTGGLSAFSNAPSVAGGTPQLADLSLRGRAEGTASLEIVGKLNPLAQPLALDIQGKVRDLELPPLSPYSVKYAGYGIERGKLSVDVAYRIAPDGQLNARNQIILNQLGFGDRVEGSEAPNLPVKLAVALLADRNGVIDINLPVSGSINDPEFRVGPIIFRLIFNLIGKAITAPFSLLASALGGGGEELSQVAFAPGSSQLDEAARQRLDTVAKALADRPGLQLTVVGHSDLETERSGYQRARLDERVHAEKRRALARGGAPVTSTVVVTPAEYPALLKEVYRRADISKPRNLIGIAKDLPVAEMENLLLAATPVPADAMRELAVARGMAVKAHMASRDLPESRMFLGAPALGRAGEAWQPHAELQLAMP